MLLSSIQSAARKNGVTCSIDERGVTLTKDERVLHGYFNGDKATVGTLVWRNPETDSMVDLFLDSYYDTIKGAMYFLNPSGVREKVQSQEVSEKDVTGVEVRKNEEKGGIEISFPSKPAQSVIDELKGKGFRWSSFNSVWWKRYNDADMTWANDRFLQMVLA
jgi:hypothetical protein